MSNENEQQRWKKANEKWEDSESEIGRETRFLKDKPVRRRSRNDEKIIEPKPKRFVLHREEM